MNKRKGFTLIELLVVISIIALLLTILMPGLKKIEEQAKAAACMSNLKQWSSVFLMYCEDNNGYFSNGRSPATWVRPAWILPLVPFFKEPKLLLCPMAKKETFEKGGDVPVTGASATTAWGPLPNAPLYGATEVSNTVTRKGQEFNVGSYAANLWFHNPLPPPAQEDPIQGNRAHKDHWRQMNVKRGKDIPIFIDSVWVGAGPQQSDIPPSWPGEGFFTDWQNEMKWVCIPRHGDFVNSVFLDFSIRKVGLKELWTLRWHRGYKVNDSPPTQWNDPDHWMYKMKDYARY